MLELHLQRAQRSTGGWGEFSSKSGHGGGGIRVGKALLNAPGHSGPRPAVLPPVGIAVAVDEARVGVRFGHRAGSPSESGRATTGAL